MIRTGGSHPEKTGYESCCGENALGGGGAADATAKPSAVAQRSILYWN